MTLSLIKENTSKPQFTKLKETFGQAMNNDPMARAKICGNMVWTAFCAPAATNRIYDSMTGEVKNNEGDYAGENLAEAPLPDSFWKEFDEALSGPEGGYDASSITMAVASLGKSINPQFFLLAEQAANNHEGVMEPSLRNIPDMISLDELGAQPEKSLASNLYKMLVENGFDAEVLDRETIGLQNLTPALRYLNTRILQMHDVWHLVGGYQTTSLHEIAISAFQLAQFGHNYSAMFLATICSISHLRQPLGFPILLQTIKEAWLHGREQPSFMDIEWEQEWQHSIDEVREKYGAKPFQGSFPADLLEKFAA